VSAVLGDGLREQVVAWRRHLHQHPELGFQEHQTARYVEEQLRDMPGLHLSRPTETSVLAVLKGGKPGRTVLLRADMDALPIEEEADVEFKSQTPGVMHACGHDGHTAMLLGAAKQLSAQAADLHGEVRFIFQHAEEVFPGGAEQLVDAGVMDGVDLAVGTHLMTSVPVGTVVLRDGALMAAPDAFDITIQGKGGHGAMPHQTVDPVVIAAQVVMAFQTAVSRLRDPIDPGVVSVTQIHGGSAHNVIPDTVTLGGTVRTFSDELRAQMPGRLETLLRGICEAYGDTYTFTYHGGYRTVNNDPATTERLRKAGREVLPEVTVSDGVPLMGGEDFSA
jgi:amidohydrolase